MPRYEIASRPARSHRSHADFAKALTAEHFRVFPRISADVASGVTGLTECRIHQTAVPHPRNSTPTLPSERTLPRTSADPSYRPEA
jgi:hypothetical protein